ncbi:MAG: ABC transporter substrate-binding protein [Solirubrobacterales bacterium]
MADYGSQLAVELDVLPHDLRPGRVHDLPGEQIASVTGERLFEPGPWPSSARGALAVRARASEGNRRWSLALDPDATWSDGSAVTAGDLVRAVENLVEPSTYAPLAWLTDPIAGCRDRRLGKGGPIGCAAAGRYRLELSLMRPVANLAARLSATAFGPLAADASLTCGPYRIAERLPGARGFVLSANPGARALRADSPQRVVLLRTNDPEQGIELYERGLLHVTANTSFPHERLPHERGRPDLHAARISLAAYLLPNPRRVGALADPRARRAISLALDRGRAADAVHGAIAPLWRFTELWGGGGEVPGRNCDSARAAARALPRALPGRLRLGYADFAPNGTVATALAAQVRDALELELIPTPLSYEGHREALRRGDFDLMYCLSPAPFDDPTSMLAPFESGGGMSGALDFADRRFDALLADADQLSDPAERRRSCERANDVLLASLPVIPLAAVHSVCLRQPSLRGFSVRPDGTIPFARLRLARRSGASE